jgi:hypothetical protein
VQTSVATPQMLGSLRVEVHAGLREMHDTGEEAAGVDGATSGGEGLDTRGFFPTGKMMYTRLVPCLDAVPLPRNHFHVSPLTPMPRRQNI